MKCEELISFLADYLDGLLPAETLASFEKHLEGCRSCRAYLATYRETILMARSATQSPRLDVSDAPEELIKAILAAVR
ncbi:MAG TPA: zf-HC2 domain-containing protein [Thermoanaerobaculia bacterium]|nr:zf-HC2 domain-containing protein [Thermoanaerobaculia bacterium]